MKNVLKLSILGVAFFVSSSMMGKDKDFALSFSNVTSKTMNFEVENGQNVSLSLYSDVYGQLYNQTISDKINSSFAYKLDELASGTYFLIAESEFKIEKYKIEVNENGVVVDKTPVSKIVKPEFTIEDNNVKIHVSNMDKGVNVSIYDLENNVYYDQFKTSENGDLTMDFKLNPLIAKTYIIEVKKNNDTFDKLVSVK